MQNEMLSGAQVLLECLHHVGVEEMFGYPGGSVIPIYDALYHFPAIKHYFVRHEQGAAHAADGYARASGKVGVCLATSGPGATNLVTGLMTASMDSIPVLAITGQVGQKLLGKDAFQESDIAGITLPITKMNYLVLSIEDLPRIIRQAYHIAGSGRKGPVLVDVPRSVQLESMSRARLAELLQQEMVLPGYNAQLPQDTSLAPEVAQLMARAERPLIIAGAGLSKEAAELLEVYAQRTRTPVTTTLLGLGALPSSDPLSLGMLGMHGTAAANKATTEADTVLAIGIRFDDRICGAPDVFCQGATIIHVDIDDAELNKNKTVDLGILCDAKVFLQELLDQNAVQSPERGAWETRIAHLKKEYDMQIPKSQNLMPQEVLRAVDQVLKGQSTVVTDVGQHQMWAAQWLQYNRPKSIITSGGAGTMGFGLPASIGAQVARKDERVVLVVGDGGFQMTMEELMMLKQYNLPIKIVLIDNGYLGMVRQWQELFHERRYSFVDLSVNPDFNKIAEAYGLRSVEIADRDQLASVLEAELTHDEPVLIHCIVEREANVFPMIPAGKSAQEMMIGGA